MCSHETCCQLDIKDETMLLAVKGFSYKKLVADFNYMGNLNPDKTIKDKSVCATGHGVCATGQNNKGYIMQIFKKYQLNSLECSLNKEQSKLCPSEGHGG